MSIRLTLLVAILVALPASSHVVFAQHAHAPYAGLQTRAIKALSPADIDDLKAGRGMRLALPAELNGYPGPVHVLELDTGLALDAAQRSRVADLVTAMRAEAVPLGEKLIAEEAALDRLFSDRTVTPENLNAAIRASEATRAALREVHLKYHLITVKILTPHQVARYAELRGYAGGHSPARHGAH